MITRAGMNDIVIVSDLDEIPSPGAIRSFDPESTDVAYVRQLHFTYFFNNLRVDQTSNNKRIYPMPHSKVRIATVKYFSDNNWNLDAERLSEDV